MKRDLSAIDRDIGQDWSRIIQEAFAHGITNDMIFGGLVTGQTALQAIHAISATKNCRVGTRRVTWDGKVYRYGEAEATLNTAFLCASTYRVEELSKVKVATGCLAADDTIIATVGATDGDGTGIIAENALADGILCVDMAGSGDAEYQMTIKSNTATVAGGDKPMTIVVDEPFPLVVTAGIYVQAMATPYKGLTNQSLSARTSYLGLPQRKATADIPFGWILTWGPCYVTPNNDQGGVNHNVGDADYSGQVVAHANVNGGSVGIHDENFALAKYAQHVGFVLSWSQAGGQGAPFIMLQISP